MAAIKQIKKLISLVSAIILILTGFTLSSVDVSAAGVALTLTPSVQNVSTTANITLAFTPAVALPTTSTISVSYPSTYTPTPGSLTSTDIATTKTGDAALTSAVASGFTSTGFTITLTTSAPLNTTSAFSIVIGGTNKLQSPSAASNNGFAISTSVGDYGGALQYVGQANVVQVRARVNPTLSFVIRDSADAQNTNTCDFGTVDTSNVYTCAYRLKVGTNASNGYTIAVSNSGPLTNGSYNITDAAAGSAGSGGTLVTAGTETYGVVITPGQVTGSGGTVTLASAYNAGVTNAVNYTSTSTNTILTANRPNNPSSTNFSTLVTQRLGVSSSTPAGVYTKTETYTVTYNF